MQSASSRLNVITMNGLTILLILAILSYFHGLFLYKPTPDIKFEITQVSPLRTNHEGDHFSFKYNLEAGNLSCSVDLSSLYNWNLKQLFVYIEVEWDLEMKSKTLSNRLIVSDWILETPEDRSKIASAYSILVKNKQVQYKVKDVYKKLSGKQLKVSINVEFMPTVGFFFKDRLKQITITAPKISQ